MNQLVILAGGKGTRMQSDKPKVLHNVNGVPIIERLLQNIKNIFAQPAIIVGYKGDEVISVLGDKYDYVRQPEQLGTGHAMWCAKKVLAPKNYKNIIVTPGDHPLISSETLKKLLDLHTQEQTKISLAIVSVPHFEGDFASFYHYGRIIRGPSGDVKGIVEFKDATEEQKRICEVNTSYYCFDADWLWENIEKLNSHNAAQEYYLTDMVKIAFEQGESIASFVIENAYEGLGVNDQRQLEIVENYCRARSERG
jgi:bifunctional UDP-N-acetylglucosamine pyrophosphorylase / glucosamine-1-phosphate N-acetyltransferase